MNHSEKGIIFKVKYSNRKHKKVRDEVLRYYIVDDDPASRMMLRKIITDGELGLVIGEAENGEKSIVAILTTVPDVVLIDFLMPDLDGHRNN